jgi:soluble lytic murein transglycosylase
MRRFIPPILYLILALIGGSYFFYQHWIHHFDDLIERQAAVYRIDKHLVWSLIYQETFFQSWKIGNAGEVGLMQVTPAVAKEWAKETGIKDFENQLNQNHIAFLQSPERNIQIGCWYLEKLAEKYRDTPAPEARILAAYNAGPSRVNEWNKLPDNPDKMLTEQEFIERIDIDSTKDYVIDILRRYRRFKD